MAKNVLVTGGAGYIGSVMIPALLNQGYNVTVVDNFLFGQTSLLDCCTHENFSIIRGDARDRDLLKGVLKNQDFIIPLAALVGAPLCDRDVIGTKSTNFGAVESLVKLSGKEQRIIIPTTNSGNGIGQKDLYCTEETPLNPISIYGNTKVQAEACVIDRGNSISFRLATVFGISPRMRLDLLVNDFTYRAVRDRFLVVFEGHFRRNYIHVRDVARAFIHAIENFECMSDNVYNLGLSEANLSKIELCSEIQKIVPDFVVIEAPIGEDPDKRDYIISNDKIEATGYKTIYKLHNGLRELVKGFQIITNSKYANV